MIRQILSQTRQKSNGSTSNEILEALSLFSTKKQGVTRRESRQNPVKPSLITSFAYGPPQERLKSHQYPGKLLENLKSQSHMEDLISILDIASVPKEAFDKYNELVDLPDASFERIIKGIKAESQLVEITKFLYHQGKLTLNKLTIIILNKNMNDFKQLPFDINKPEDSGLKWPGVDFTKWKITLLKKYHMQHRPLSVVKNLKTHFPSLYFPAIKANEIPHFYERIVWRFYFKYVQDLPEFQDEAYMIQQLNNVHHSFIIWESCGANFEDVARSILKTHSELKDVHKVYFSLSLFPSVKQLILQELEDSKGAYSEALWSLKKPCIDRQLFGFRDLDDSTARNRATYYLVLDYLQKWAEERVSGEDLLEIRDKLKALKSRISLDSLESVESWDTKLLLLGIRFMKDI